MVLTDLPGPENSLFGGSEVGGQEQTEVDEATIEDATSERR